MSTLDELRVADEQVRSWARDLRRIVNAREEGLRWADNVGEVVTFRYLASRAPIDVRIASRGVPLAVLVLRAVNLTDRSIESGCRISWTLGVGAVRVQSIDVSDTDDEYEIHIGLLMG